MKFHPLIEISHNTLQESIYGFLSRPPLKYSEFMHHACNAVMGNTPDAKLRMALEQSAHLNLTEKAIRMNQLRCSYTAAKLFKSL